VKQALERIGIDDELVTADPAGHVRAVILARPR